MWVAVFGESLIAHLFPADACMWVLGGLACGGRRIIGGVGLFVLLLGFGSWSRLGPEPSQRSHVTIAMQGSGTQ